MKTNAFPGFDNIKQLYDWNCYTKQDLVDYVNMNCLTKEEYTKICGEPFSESWIDVNKVDTKREDT